MIFLFSFQSDFVDYSIKIGFIDYNISLYQLPLVYLVINTAWFLKFIPAFISDLIGCCGGYHRKPYILISNICGFIISMLLMYRGDTVHMDKQVFVSLLIGINTAFSFMDVSYDASIVEDIRDSTTEKRPYYFNRVQYIRLTGSLFGNTLGPFLWGFIKSKGIFLINSVVFLIGAILSFIFLDYPRSNILSNYNTPDLREVDLPIQGSDDFVVIMEQSVDGTITKQTAKVTERLTIWYLLKVIKKVLSINEIKRFIIYNFISGMFPGTGLVMFYYLSARLGFSADVFAVYGILTTLARMLGTKFYSFFLMGYNMRSIFINIQLITVCLGFIPLILSGWINGYTFPEVEYEVMTTLVQSSDSYYIPTTSNLFLFLHEKANMNITSSQPLIDLIGIPSKWAYGFYLVFTAFISNIKFYPMMYITSISCERAVEGSVISVIMSIIAISYGIKYCTESFLMKSLSISLQNFDGLVRMAFISCMCDIIGFYVVWYIVPNKTAYIIEDNLIKEKQSLKFAREAEQTLNNNNDEDEVVL